MVSPTEAHKKAVKNTVKHTVLGSPGGFGLALTPAVRCDKDNTPDPNLISKVFYKAKKSKEYADEEWEFAKQVGEIDPNNKFTLKMVELCEKKPTVFNIANIASLYLNPGNVFEKGNELVDVSIINMANGGRALNVRDKAKIELADFITSVRALLTGLVECYKKNLVHRDIKHANMLINDRNTRIILIDFGMSISPKKLYLDDEMHILNHAYPAYPPEFPIIGALYYHMHTVNPPYSDLATNYIFINKVVNSINRNIAVIKRSNNNADKEIALLVNDFINTFLNNVAESDENDATAEKEGRDGKYENPIDLLHGITETMKLSEKMDNYSLGVVLFTLVLCKNIKDIDPTSTDFKIVKRNTAFLLKLNEIVMGMIQFDPRKRDTPGESLVKLNAFDAFVKAAIKAEEEEEEEEEYEDEDWEDEEDEKDEYDSDAGASGGRGKGGSPPTAMALALMAPPRRASRVRSAPSATGRIVVPRVEFSEDRKEAYRALATALDLNPDVADFTINMLSNKHTFDLDQKSPPRSVPANIGGRRQSKRK